MTAIWLFARAELRRRWSTVVVLAVLIGLGGGVALTALAGAIRTDRAVSRMVAYSLPDQGGFSYGNVTATGSGSSLDLLPGEQRVVDLPQIAAWFRLPEVDLATDPTGRSASGLDVMASPDGSVFHDVDRPVMVTGKLPATDRPFDVAVNQVAAKKLHLHVGSSFDAYSYSASQIAGSAGQGAGGGPGLNGTVAPGGPRLTLRVTGVFRLPSDVSAVTPYVAGQNVSYEGKEKVYLPPSFLPELARLIGLPVQGFPYMHLISVRLKHGPADYHAFAAAAAKVGGGQVFVGDPGNVMGTDTAAASASRATRLEAMALLVFGLVAALITILIVGQAIARQVLLRSDDHTVLRAVGATRRQLVGAALVVSAITGVAGALLAFLVAVVASPLMPIGLARQAEIRPGVAVDPLVLVGGCAALAVLIALWAVPAAWRASTVGSESRLSPMDDRRRSFLASGLAAMLRSPAAAMGARFGLQRGSGRRAVPVGSALLAAMVAVAGLAASLTFGASLSHLGSTPREQGWNWDVLVGNPNDFGDREQQYAQLLARNHLVGSYSAIAVIAGAEQGNAYIGNVPLGTMLAIDPLKGSVEPALTRGRAPQGLHEIVLGTGTLAKLHKKVGQSVQMDTGPPVGKITMTIVGSMIAPSVGDIFTNSLGDGAWISGTAYKAVQAQVAAAGGDDSSPPSSEFPLFAVRYAPGVSPATGFASLQRQFGPVVLRRLPPADVIDLRSVQSLPFVLAGLIALLGLGTIGHTLVTSVRRRRQDLALLKTIGFVRRQVGATVAWQATSFMVVALLLGLPLGVAAGRWAWHAVASSISSASPSVLPVVALVLIVPAALVVANLLAAGPGWAAAQIRPATALRDE